MGVAVRGGPPLARRWLVLLIAALLAVSSVPALATVSGLLYSPTTSTARSPSVILQAGTSGQSSLDSTRISSTVSATAGLQFYETSNGVAQSTGPALDKSASQHAGPASTITLNNLATSTANELVYIDVMMSSSSVSVSSMSNTGTAVLSWTHRATVSNTNARLETWWAAAASAGTYSITANIAGGTADLVMIGITVENVAVSEPFDPAVASPSVTSGTTSSSNQAVSTSLTTQNLQDYIIGVLASTDTTNPTGGTGFTVDQIQHQGGILGSDEYWVANAAQSGLAVGFTIKNSGANYSLLADALVGIPTAPPPALDKTAQSANNAATGLSVNAQTSNDNELIYVVAAVDGTTAVSAGYPSSAPALTFTSRGSYSDPGSTVTIDAWYAIAPTANTYSVTVQLSASDDWVLLAFSVSGVDTTSPFDPGVTSMAHTAGTTTSGNQLVGTSFTTQDSSDFVFGGIVMSSNKNPSTATGYSSIQTQHTNTIAAGTEYLISSSAGSYNPTFKVPNSGTNYVAIGEAFAPAPPVSPNTALSAQSSSGSFNIGNGQTYYLISPAYPASSLVYAGTWTIDLWVQSNSAASLSFTVFAVDSNGVVQATFLSSGTIASTTSKSEVKQTFAGAQGTVPSGGNIVIALSSSSATFTVYWGSGEATYFKTPSTYDYVLSAVNGASSSWQVNLGLVSSSSTSRLSNLTVFFDPSTQEFVLGSLNTGPAVTLAASSTLNISLNATATSMPTGTPATLTFSFKVLSAPGLPYSYYTIVVQVG